MVLYRCHRCGTRATNLAASGFTQQADRLACASCSQDADVAVMSGQAARVSVTPLVTAPPRA